MYTYLLPLVDVLYWVAYCISSSSWYTLDAVLRNANFILYASPYVLPSPAFAGYTGMGLSTAL